MLCVGMGGYGSGHVMLWVGMGGHGCNLKGKCWALQQSEILFTQAVSNEMECPLRYECSYGRRLEINFEKLRYSSSEKVQEGCLR